MEIMLTNAGSFGPLVEECRKRGIGRTTAHMLAKEGALKTFLLGRKRYVLIESFAQLALQSTQSDGVRK